MSVHNKLRDVFTIIGLSVCAKSLLVYTYVSTDFEVHRNWLAITYSLPVEKWYTEATSQWTLDYPPLFAWFEWFLSQFAAMVDPEMLKISSLNYKSHKTILFQRFSVIITDFVLVYAAVVWHDILFETTRRMQRLFQPIVLVGLILNPGLLIVDHMHFQYNGILMGIMLLSLARIYKGEYFWGAFWFSVLLNMKHIYLYIAPPFFFYLLKSYVFEKTTLSTSEKLQRLLKLGSIVIGVFAVSFGPFIYHGQLPQIASRLFPIQRGLVHAYWAPNLWAFYAGLDKFLSLALSKLGYRVGHHSLTSGLVQESSFSVLPNIPGYVTLIMAAALMIPSCVKVFRKGNKNTFLQSVVYCGFTSYLVGYHVHEKAILIPLLCMVPLIVITSDIAAVFEVFSAIGHYSLTPLIFTEEETFIKIAFILLYQFYMTEAINSLYQRSLISPYGKFYTIGFVPLFLYAEWFWKILTPRLEFMPLMVTSLYCAFGVFCVYVRTLVMSFGFHHEKV